jgi:hypothetical protein
MNRQSKKITILLFLAFITVLFTVILPAHYHNDYKNHNDCQLCLLSGEPVINVDVIIALVVSVLLLYLSLIIARFLRYQPQLICSTRGPPPADDFWPLLRGTGISLSR